MNNNVTFNNVTVDIEVFHAPELMIGIGDDYIDSFYITFNTTIQLILLDSGMYKNLKIGISFINKIVTSSGSF